MNPDPALEVKLALQKQTAERAQRRRKWIRMAGIVAYLVAPFSIAFLASMTPEPLYLVFALGVPACIGASIAYFGMTMTDHHRDPWEWGFGIPSRCFAVGTAPLVLLCGIAVFLLPVAILYAVTGWMMTILGAGVTAWIIDRWFFEDK